MNTEPSASLSNDDLREDLIRERELNNKLTLDLKNLERNHSVLVSELRTQLKAEMQKSASLEKSIQNFPFTMGQVVELQSQLKQAEIKQKVLAENFKLQLAELEIRHKEKLDAASDQRLEEFKNYAMAQITEKEKVIIEDKMIIERSDTLINDMSQEIEYIKSLLLSERQKYRTEIERYKDRTAELEQELKDSFLAHPQRGKSIGEDHLRGEMEENQNLKIQIEGLLEDLELKDRDLQIAGKKIAQLKESRFELAETINSLENKIDSLTKQKDEIVKGLQSKEKTIHLLEEEMSSNAEGIVENYKAIIDEDEKKIKKLERKIREIEQKNEDKLEENLGIIAVNQIQINDLTRKIAVLEKEKEFSIQKQLVSQKKISELENKIFEFEQQQSSEIEKFKNNFKDKILALTRERDELEIKVNELQEQIGFSRPSIFEPGGSLFDELAQLPEGRFSRLSLKPTMIDDSKRMEHLISQLAEKETGLKSLISEKIILEEKLKNVMGEFKDIQSKLMVTAKHSEDLKNQLEIATWELESLRSDKDTELVKGKILVLESEKELMKAERSRLETELMLSKENWAELNNNICKEMYETQADIAKIKSDNIRLKDENEQLKQFKDGKLHKKKKSIGNWFRRD